MEQQIMSIALFNVSATMWYSEQSLNLLSCWATYLQGDLYSGDIPSAYDSDEQSTTFRRFSFVVYRDLVYDFGGFQIARLETLIDLMDKTMRTSEMEFWVKFSHAAIHEQSQTLFQAEMIDFGSSLPPSFNNSDVIREIGSWLMALAPHKNAFDYALLINDPFDFEIPDEEFVSFFGSGCDMIETWYNVFEHINWTRYVEREDGDYETFEESIGQEIGMMI